MHVHVRVRVHVHVHVHMHVHVHVDVGVGVWMWMCGCVDVCGPPDALVLAVCSCSSACVVMYWCLGVCVPG